jgi:hypothetical protein
MFQATFFSYTTFYQPRQYSAHGTIITLKQPQNMKERGYIIFESAGEFSKDLLGTAVVRAIKKKYPAREIIVTTFHPEPWLHNPNVYRIFNLAAAPYFFEDYVRDRDTLIFKHDPYDNPEYVRGSRHIVDIWCDLCKVPADGYTPDLFFTYREIEVATRLLASEQPLFLFQAAGEVGGLPYPYPWSRNAEIGVIQQVAKAMTEDGFRVAQIALADDHVIPGYDRVGLDIRLLFYAPRLAGRRLFIDSFIQHSAAATGDASVVLWNTLKPEVHGHDLHANIQGVTSGTYRSHKERTVDEIRATKIFPKTPATISGGIEFNAKDIIKALRSL